jgi:hypothetical protein
MYLWPDDDLFRPKHEASEQQHGCVRLKHGTTSCTNNTAFAKRMSTQIYVLGLTVV